MYTFHKEKVSNTSGLTALTAEGNAGSFSCAHVVSEIEIVCLIDE